MELASRPTHQIPGQVAIWTAVILAWALALALPMLGHGDAVSHHTVAGGDTIPSVATILLFLAAWQVMTAAMMLPSSAPLVGLFTRVSQRQDRPGVAIASFLAAYFAVWTGFALVALAGDALLHRLVNSWAWLADRPWLIAGTVLVLAGAFQFSPLKEKCLDACRSPVGFLWRYYGRGAGPAWNLGIRHGMFCLGCCWALMLTMFAVGVGSLTWMAGLTGVMLIEKTSVRGRRLVPLVGAALVLWGALVLMQPGWLPDALRGLE